MFVKTAKLGMFLTLRSPFLGSIRLGSHCLRFVLWSSGLTFVILVARIRRDLRGCKAPKTNLAHTADILLSPCFVFIFNTRYLSACGLWSSVAAMPPGSVHLPRFGVVGWFWWCSRRDFSPTNGSCLRLCRFWAPRSLVLPPKRRLCSL